jgi:competence protein ComEC
MRMTVACLLLLTVAVSPAPRTRDALEIYVIDVEGGKSTLVVSPSGESMLIDTGNIGDGAQRDADRIMAAVADAGLQRIDHLVTTHWHRDHVGAMASIANRIPIQDFIDHGPNVQPNPAIDTFLRRTYPRLYHRSTHIVVRAGDAIPIAGVDVRVVTSAGATIQAPLPGAGDPNFLCTRARPPAVDKTENGQSIGLHLVFGRFRVLDLGDVTINQEFQLMCPDNRIGAVDLFMVSHHGQPTSNSRVLVHALDARVAIMNNGIRKGGHPQVMEVLHSAPGLEDLWQLHPSQLTGQEYAVPGVFIANLEAPIHNGPAHWLKVSALSDGSFSVTNTRNGFTKLYGARSYDQ